MNTAQTKLLCLVEDDPIMGESLCHRFSLEGLSFEWHRDGETALKAILEKGYAAIVSDIRLPDLSGEELFRAVLEHDVVPPPTLFITGFGSVDQAVNLLKLGARDYITKPFDLDELLEKVRTLCPVLFLGDAWLDKSPVLGVSPGMLEVQDRLTRLANYKSGVLFTGESGVGKEHAAQFIHGCTDADGDRPFQAVNCASMHENLLEAELFGHEKGAFTGANQMRQGVFERADGGTLFLDEVGEMSSGMQPKLLRVLQDGVFERVGGQRSITIDVRVLCATNRDLKGMVESGQFRDDLYYRINVVHIQIPPLRERREDILWFAERFLSEYGEEHGERHILNPAAERYLLDQAWPGNVRELKHALERACIFAEQEALTPLELGASRIDGVDYASKSGADLKTFMEQCEQRHIVEALEAHQWRVADTAVSLGISRKNLWEKMRKYELAQKQEN